MKRLVFLAAAMSACWWPPSQPPEVVWEPVDAGSGYCRPFEAGCCKRPSDCGKDRYRTICTLSGTCLPLCETATDCDSGELCEDALCRPAACGSDDECGEAEQCLDGACEAAPQAAAVDSCQVLPDVALVKTGATSAFTVVARDATGETLAYKGAVTWSVDEADRGAVTNGVLTGGVEAGGLRVQASVGSTNCTVARVRNFAAPTEGKVRVIVADIATQEPVPHVKIAFNGEPAVDAAEGVIEFDTVDVPFDVHAYPVGDAKYAWVSTYGTTSRDILLYTRRALAPARFTGTLPAQSFDGLSNVKGSVHLALQGSSIAGNLFDAGLATMLGDPVETTIDTGSQSVDVRLPEGMVLGLGQQMFRGASDQPFAIASPPGVRTLWGLGGNAEFALITEALGPVWSGEEYDPGRILTPLLPVFGRLQSGALTGVVAEAGKTTSLDGSDGVSTLKLDTLLRLRVEASLPKLPTYKTSSPDGPITRPFDAAIVLGGAHYDTQGFVPLGMSAGVDVLPKGSTDGKVDPVEIGSTAAGKVAIRVAPRHSGMETSRHVFVALATSLDNLLGDDDDGEPTRVLSGLVTSPGELSHNSGDPTQLSFEGAFLGVPDLPGLTDRTLSAGSRVDGASFQRLTIRDADGREWLVYFAPGEDVQVTLPTPPPGLTDRFLIDEEQPRALLHSVRLNDPALTYDEVLAFGSDNLDDLSARLEAFSLIELER